MTTVLEGRPTGNATAEAGAVPSVRSTGTAQYVLTLACPERPGIVRAITAFLADRGFDIVEHQQFDDHMSGKLYLRTAFTPGDEEVSAEGLSAEFAAVADEFDMDFRIHDGRPQRLLVMVSKFGHCLNDLIFRWRAGSLGAEIAVVVSNHEDLRAMAEAAGLPFIHVPVTAGTKPEAEARLLQLVAEYQADLVVLARYMQVVSPEFCARFPERLINIHHSFLPAFVGANPYQAAHDRGVKLIGATAHYVTPELDAGPIIEQEVARVDHRATVDDMRRVGRYVERQVLAQAVTWHVEDRVIVEGLRTIVFA
jgi:formyltetrahydrofolate deformylase